MLHRICHFPTFFQRQGGGGIDADGKGINTNGLFSKTRQELLGMGRFSEELLYPNPMLLYYHRASMRALGLPVHEMFAQQHMVLGTVAWC